MHNKNGYLEHWEIATLNKVGTETGLKIYLESYSGAGSGIPGYSPYFIGIISVSMIIYLLKINKFKKKWSDFLVNILTPHGGILFSYSFFSNIMVTFTHKFNIDTKPNQIRNITDQVKSALKKSKITDSYYI